MRFSFFVFLCALCAAHVCLAQEPAPPPGEDDVADGDDQSIDAGVPWKSIDGGKIYYFSGTFKQAFPTSTPVAFPQQFLTYVESGPAANFDIQRAGGMLNSFSASQGENRHFTAGETGLSADTNYLYNGTLTQQGNHLDFSWHEPQSPFANAYGPANNDISHAFWDESGSDGGAIVHSEPLGDPAVANAHGFVAVRAGIASPYWGGGGDLPVSAKISVLDHLGNEHPLVDFFPLPVSHRFSRYDSAYLDWGLSQSSVHVTTQTNGCQYITFRLTTMGPQTGSNYDIYVPIWGEIDPWEINP